MLEGHFDRLRANIVEGWVWDSSAPDTPVHVEIVNEEGRLVAMGLADRYRSDLHSAGKGNGAHGFAVAVARHVIENSSQLRIRSLPHNYELMGSPVVLNGGEAPVADQLSPTASPDLLKRFEADRQLQLDYARLAQELSGQLETHRSTIKGVLTTISDEFGTLRQAREPDAQAPPSPASDVLFFPPIDWDYRYQRPQHLASALGAAGHRVFFIAPTFDTSIGFKIYGTPCTNVYLVRLGCPVPHPAINKEKFSATQASSLRKSLDALCAAASVKQPIALLENPVWYSLFHPRNGERVVYDCLDFFMGFEASSESMARVEQQLIREAALVITTSRALEQYVQSEKPRQRPVIIRNACSDVFFTIPAPVKLKGRPPEIGYVGALEHWFDVDLVLQLAQRHRNWNFTLAGNPSVSVKEALQDQPNVSLIGEVPLDMVPMLLAKFDVCIIPFKNEEIVRYTNPVKAYEYLAAGRGVVATPMEELDQFSPFIRQARDVEEFSRYIKEQLLFADNRAYFIDRRLSVAGETWSARGAALRAVLGLLKNQSAERYP